MPLVGRECFYTPKNSQAETLKMSFSLIYIVITALYSISKGVVVFSSKKCLKFSLEGWSFDDLFIYLSHENNIVASFSNKERRSLSANWRDEPEKRLLSFFSTSAKVEIRANSKQKLLVKLGFSAKTEI